MRTIARNVSRYKKPLLTEKLANTPRTPLFYISVISHTHISGDAFDADDTPANSRSAAPKIAIFGTWCQMSACPSGDLIMVVAGGRLFARHHGGGS